MGLATIVVIFVYFLGKIGGGRIVRVDFESGVVAVVTIVFAGGLTTMSCDFDSRVGLANARVVTTGAAEIRDVV